MDNHKGTRTPLQFFLLVYALSLPLWIIETIIDVKGLPLDIPITDIAAAFTPLIAASILVYKEAGWGSVKRLFLRVVDFPRITKKLWYLPIVFLPFLLYLLIYLLICFAGLPMPSKIHNPFQSIPFLFPLFFIGAICEEIGYMGYAIEPMQERFGALPASILMGIPWAVWHYPSIIQHRVK